MIASIPLLAAGYPPISIPAEHRDAYYIALGKVSYSFGYYDEILTVHVSGVQGRLRPVGAMFCRRNGFYDPIHRRDDDIGRLFVFPQSVDRRLYKSQEESRNLLTAPRYSDRFCIP